MKKIPLLLAFALTGCGLEPVYQKHPTLDSSSASKVIVKVKKGEGFTAYQLKRALEAQLNRLNTNKKYTLELTISESENELVFAPDGTARRTQIILEVSYILLNEELKLIQEKTTKMVSSYTTNQAEEFANISSKDMNKQRLTYNMAMEITRDLGVKLKHLND